MAKRVTGKQLEVLRLIAQHRQEHGFSPTVRELSEALDISPAAVACRLDGLAKKGLIERHYGKSRTLLLTELGVGALSWAPPVHCSYALEGFESHVDLGDVHNELKARP